jgi:ribosome-binding factor A
LKFRKDESFAEADRIESLLRDPKVARDLGADADLEPEGDKEG